ncbi:hypothetical protein [Rathayibacter iranicus]|uniref:Uncharacterized protein n=1 Tax=Rathayibacter iranicus TaxID=59737 RepID=A0AAD1AIN4_9MICO|nr:hypothetical protein [Rathayibacter iranicus]AZZ57131.1 hypothetical protein C7V51_15585 [Rathayibacter iranicus]
MHAARSLPVPSVPRRTDAVPLHPHRRDRSRRSRRRRRRRGDRVPRPPGGPGCVARRVVAVRLRSTRHLCPGYLCPGYLCSGYLCPGHRSDDREFGHSRFFVRCPGPQRRLDHRGLRRAARRRGPTVLSFAAASVDCAGDRTATVPVSLSWETSGGVSARLATGTTDAADGTPVSLAASAYSAVSVDCRDSETLITLAVLSAAGTLTQRTLIIQAP